MDSVGAIPLSFYEHLPECWTFLLLVIRYTALLMMLPGLSVNGEKGKALRTAPVLALSFVSMISGQVAPLPDDLVLMAAKMMSEFLFGFMLGFLPAMISAGVQMAAQLSTGTMGLGAAQLVDPTLGVSVSSLGRIIDGVVVCIFLALGGHHVVLYAASGLGGTIVPGTFMVNADSVTMLMEQTGEIFVMGVMLSAPVIVALLLTQFVLGLISKAVPQVNIFIVSFPLTIGIGLVLSVLSLPEILVFVDREFKKVEQQVIVLTEATEKSEAAPAKGLTQLGL